MDTKFIKSRQATAISPSAVAMTVCKDFESCRDMESEWDAFVEQVSGDIFLTYDWCRIWWKYYGQNRTLRVYLFRADTQMVGLLPMFLEKVSLGPASLCRVKVVGSDFSFGQFRPAIAPGYLDPVLCALLRDFQSLPCDQFILGPVAGRYEGYPEMIDRLRQACSDGFSLCVRNDVVQTYYPLADTHEQWLEKFSSSQRNNIRRDYRGLKKQSLGFRFEIASEDTWEEMFEDFVELHQADWNRKGKLGHFGNWPRSLAFHRELAPAQLKKGRLRLFRLQCSDGSRAYAYNFRCGDMVFEYLLGRTLSAPQGVSLGRLLHSESVRQMTGESVRWVDAMQGRYEYKCQLGGQQYPLRQVYLNREGMRSRIRIRLFKWTAALFHLVYYKIYYYRLAVLLPIRWRKELRRSWIRSCSL